MDPKTLYLVATPIGNLSDLSSRALETLKGCDLIAAEDTRVTAKICARFDISTPLFPYHEHNKRAAGEKLLSALESGKSVALTTDAGTPAVSDPGEDLVKLCVERGIRVIPVPGACAALCALIVSGFDTTRFVFEGFLPLKKKDRDARLDALARETRTSILYEAPHRLTDTLTLLAARFPDRRAALCRELTKLNEEILRGTLTDLSRRFAETAPRGEFVLVLEGAKPENPDFSDLSIEEHVQLYLAQGIGKKEAIRRAAAERGLARNEVYIRFVNDKTEH